MKELAVVERFIVGKLLSYTVAYGWAPPQIAPFDIADGENPVAKYPLPLFYLRLVSTGDRNAVGPGPRVLVWADYEIGVFHDRNSFGATFPTIPTGSVALLDVLGAIDNLFQNYAISSPTPGLGGTVYSVERQFSVRMAERGSDGKLFRRDGGVYRFHIEAD